MASNSWNWGTVVLFRGVMCHFVNHNPFHSLLSYNLFLLFIVSNGLCRLMCFWFLDVCPPTPASSIHISFSDRSKWLITIPCDYFSPTPINTDLWDSAPWTDHWPNYWTLASPPRTQNLPSCEQPPILLWSRIHWYLVPWHSILLLPPKPWVSTASVLCLIDLFVILSFLVIGPGGWGGQGWGG